MYDIAIVGGGAAGGALALGLASSTSYRVALIDAGMPPKSKDISIGFDQRTIALSQRSLDILKSFDVALAELTQSPIKHIHVSDQHHAGQTRLHAADYGIDAFGSVVSLAALGAVIYSHFDGLTDKQFDYLSATQVEKLERFASHNELTLSNGSTVQAKLVVLAEGGRTNLAESVGLTRNSTEYRQTALTFVARMTEPHNGWAYERFTQHGPLALLPLSENEYGVVWTLDPDAANQLVEGSSSAFIQALQNAFGYRSGLVIDVSEISIYPLVLTQLNPFYAQGVVAVGNSAQSLHPIAGQGVNLGFRDVFELVQHLKACEPQSLGSYTHLSRYADIRRSDKQETISLTDGLVSLFSNDYLPLVSGRNIALTAMNALDSVKSTFAKRAMGFKHAAF